MLPSVFLVPFTTALGQDIFLTQTESYDADVIIIGAGWAGMTAADHLHRGGTNFLVLEADNRTGGRTRAFEFGSDSVGTFVFEQGSNWVQGTGLAGTGLERHDRLAPKVYINPVDKLAQEQELHTVCIPGSTDGNMSNYIKIYDENGVDLDATGELRTKANDALTCVNSTAGDAKNSVSVRTGLTKCGWKPSTDAEWAVDWALASDDAGVWAKGQALNGFLPDPSYDWWGPDDQFVVDQHPRGFARLIDGMVRDTVPAGDPRVILNAKVSKLKWGSTGVTISTTDGRTFKGKHAISTMSAGVIKKHHKEIFSPALPTKQAKSINNNHQPMGNLTHVLIQFPEVWWDNSIPAWISANTGGKASRGNFTAWHNLNMDGMIPGSQTLLSFLGEPEASIYGAMNEAEIMPVIVERLRAQNPDKTIPEGTAAFIKNWGVDPLFYGAYAYAQPDVRWKSTWKRSLKVNKKTIVRFAGEATCDNLNGYTHGALQSGLEAAAKYLHEFENGPDPSKDDALRLCDWTHN